MNKFTLKELGEFKNGANYSKGSYGKGDKIVNVKDLFKGRFVPIDSLDELDSNALKNKSIYLVEDGDILFTRSSLVRSGAGMCAMIKQPKEDILFCGFIIRYRVDKTKVDPLYMLYMLRSPRYRKLFTGTQQTNITNINQETLGDIEIFLPVDVDGNPDVLAQKKIVEILDKIDTRIENNRLINGELESLSKLIYNYWFLQFDFPNEKGKPYKSSGGKMVWNEELKRQIPAGWKTTTLGEITICHDSKRIPLSSKERESKKGDIPYYGATGIMDYVDEAIFEGEYILMAEDGSVMDENGNPILQRISGKTWVNNHAHVLQPSKLHCCKLIMMLLKDVSVMKIKTGSIQMKINQENMKKIVLPDIPEDIVMKVNQLLEPIDNKIQHYQKENTELESLRDFLLPLLMSGQVMFAAKN